MSPYYQPVWAGGTINLVRNARLPAEGYPIGEPRIGEFHRLLNRPQAHEVYERIVTNLDSAVAGLLTFPVAF